MQNESPQKLEILNQFRTKYPGWVNQDLLSIKYCQDGRDAYLEMYFITAPDQPAIINLDFITNGDDYGAEVEDFPGLFHPKADVVDNARRFVELDSYSLINCVDGLFTQEAEVQINESFQKERNQGRTD